MQQVRSVEVLASEVAGEMAQRIAMQPGLTGVPVYLRSPDSTLFSQRFGDLLVSELTRRGVSVSSEQEDTLVLEFQVVDETLVSVALLRDNRYLVQTSKVFYTGAPEISQKASEGVWEKYALRRPASIR